MIPSGIKGPMLCEFDFCPPKETFVPKDDDDRDDVYDGKDDEAQYDGNIRRI